jgi:hypothetical protein
MRKNIKRAGFVVVAALAASSVSVAYAAWSVTGSSNKNPSAGTNGTATASLALTVSAPATDNTWYPQEVVSGVRVTVENTNPFRISVSKIEVSEYHSDNAACEEALKVAKGVFTGSFSTPFALLGSSAAADEKSATKELTVTASNDLPNECQDRNILITFTATGASASA